MLVIYCKSTYTDGMHLQITKKRYRKTSTTST